MSANGTTNQDSTSVHQERRWAGVLVVFVVAALVTIPGLGLKDFCTRGEPREALVAQAMISSGSWILPSVYNGDIPSKPPLTHWLMVSAASITGELNEFSARLPSALISAAFLAFFYALLRRWSWLDGDVDSGSGGVSEPAAQRLRQRHALLAVIFLATSSEWFRAAESSRVDMVHAALFAAGLLTFFIWCEQNFRWSIGALCSLLFAGAMLSKGPVGIVLPALIALAYLRLRSYKFSAVILRVLQIFVPALVIGSSWYFFASRSGGETFYAKFYDENIARFLGTMEDPPHQHTIFYLFGVSLLGLLPWAIVAVPTLARVAAALLGAEYNRAALRRHLTVDLPGWWRRQPRFVQFSLLSTLVVLLFYSIPSTKRGVYLLPLYPFVSAWLAAIALRWWQRSPEAARHLRTAVAAGFVLLWFAAMIIAAKLPSIVGVRPDRADPAPFPVIVVGEIFRDMPLISMLLFVAPVVLALLILIYTFRKRWLEGSLWYITALYALTLISLNVSLLPVVSRALSAKRFAAEIAPAVAGADLSSFQNEFYGLSFYLNQRINALRAPEGGGPARNAWPARAFVVLYEHRLDSFYRDNGGQGLWTLLSRSPNAIDKAGKHVVLIERKET